jgi:ubiquinone/menaquinone biosynthesis C-methylase UbiE
MKLIKFIKLAKRRQIGYFKGNPTNYIKFQNFQAKEILSELKKRNVNLHGKTVLELAVGTGGYSPVFKQGCKDYIMNDITRPAILDIDNSIKFKKFDVTKKYPFEDNSFDFVFSCSLIEHVKDPKKMMDEIKRVLKPNGLLYLSFPPFYSPVGGHYFKPFHYFGEKIAVELTKIFKHSVNADSYSKGFGSFGLYIRKIGSVRRLIKKEGFSIIDYWARYPSWSFIAKIPILNEILTWHVCFLCKNKK